MSNQNQALDCIVRFHDIQRLNELERCVFSLIGQRYRPLNIILVLQRFSDEAVAVIKTTLAPLFQFPEAPKLSIHNWNEEKVTVADARTFLLNYGLGVSHGRYLAFLDYDDVLFPEAYELLVAKLQEQKAAIAFASVEAMKMEIRNHSFYIVGPSYPPPYKGKNLIDLFIGNFCPIHSYLIDKFKIPKDILNFDTSLMIEEDYDLLLRICASSIADFSLLGINIGHYYWKTDGSNTLATPEGVTGYKSTFNKNSHESSIKKIQTRKKTTFVSIPVQIHLGLPNPRKGITIHDVLMFFAPSNPNDQVDSLQSQDNTNHQDSNTNDCHAPLPVKFKRGTNHLKSKPKIEKLLKTAIAHHQAQQLSDAESIYCSILQADPTHPDANHNLGVLMLQTNQPNAAFSYFKAAVESNPNQKQYWVSYIDALIQNKQIEVTRKLLEQARQYNLPSETIEELLKKVNFAYWMSLGMSAHKLQDYETSLSYFQKASALAPEHPTLPIKIAAELRELGRLDEAAAILQELLKRQPNSIQSYNCLAVIFREQQDHEQALIYFQKSLQLQPENQTLPIEIASELRELGRLDEARQILLLLKKANSINNPSNFWLNLGQISQFEDNSNEAISCFQKGIDADPTQDQCFGKLAEEYLHLGVYDHADKVLIAGLKTVQQSLLLEIIRIRVLMARGLWDDAGNRAEHLWRSNLGNFEIGHALVNFYIETANFSQAEIILAKILGKTLEQRVILSMLRIRLAHAQFDLNILDDLNDVLRINPKNIQAHSFLGLVHLMRGNIQAAGVELNVAETLFANHVSSRMRNQKKSISLRMVLWRECCTNHAIEYALTEIHTLPLIQQPAALAKIFRDESQHPASAIALLITLRQLGIWEYPTPLLFPDNKQIIPRRIIQFWDSAKIPDEIQDIMQSWPQICKGFDYQLFNDESAAAFLKEHFSLDVQRAFYSANHPAMRSDLLRLAYLSIYGGIYVDADNRCRHNLDSWLRSGYHLFLYQEFIGTIGNNFLAATPRHPFIIFVLENVVKNILQGQGNNIYFMSGPGAITTMFCHYYLNYLECGKLPPGIVIRDVYHMQTRISMHLYHAYKQSDKHWLTGVRCKVLRNY